MNRLQIKAKVLEGAAVIYPGQYLNQLKGESIESHCRQLLSEGVRRLVINFQETEFINSIGISILLGVIETVGEAEGTLLLSNMSSSNRELFEMLGLTSQVRIAETEEIALATLGTRGH